MFKEGFGYNGNRYDIIKCLEGNSNITVIESMINYRGPAEGWHRS